MFGLIVLPAVVTCLLVLGMSLVVCAGRIGSGGSRQPMLHDAGPSWRMSVTVVLVLLLAINLNLWVPGAGLFAGLFVAASLSCIAAALIGRRAPLPWCAGVACSSVAMLVAILVILVWFYAMIGVRGLWLLEGPNHDSLFFFEGAKWATAHPIRVEPASVVAQWELGTCRQGAVYIGTDCAAYRGGTYTMLSLGSWLLPALTPNQVLATMAFAALFPLLGMLPLARPDEARTLAQRCISAAAIGVAGTLVFLSPAMVGGVINGNVATVFGASVIAMMTFWVVMPSVSPVGRAISLGFAAALAGHVYGEAAVYACWMVATGVVADAVRLRKPTWVLSGGAAAMAVFALGLNVQLADLIRSYIEIGKVASGGQWEGYFLNAPSLAWLGAPFASVLMGGGPSVTTLSVVCGAVLTTATLVVGWQQRLRVPTAGLALLTALLVGFIEVRDYAYGEHKIIQLLGPAWTALLLAGLWNIWSDGGVRRSRARQLLVACVLLLLVFQSGAFVLRAKHLLVASMPSHALAKDFASGLDKIRPGDEVVIDDAGVGAQERFQKTHYLAFLIHERGGRALLPDITDEPMRGGYMRSVLNDGFEHARTPDWLVQLKSDIGTKAMMDRADRTGTVQTQEYILFRLDGDAPEPMVLAGLGWYPCETTHCWTRRRFTVETFTPASCNDTDEGAAELVLYLGFFNPPADARVSVETRTRTFDVSVKDGQQVRVPLQQGWDQVAVTAGWQIQSPQGLGFSSDSRDLFARIDKVNASCRAP